MAKKKRPAKKRSAVKRPAKRPAKKKTAKKKNPAVKMKKLTGSTGWIAGDAFKIVKKKGGAIDVLVRRGGSKKSKRSR